MEIAKGVHRIQCIFGGNRVSFVHLFVGDEAAMLVDTCCAHNPAQEILPYMEKIGLDREKLKYILISHSDLDHQGGNQPMKDAVPNALFLCHNLDRPWIESTESLITGRYMQFDVDNGFETPASVRADIHKDCLSCPIDLTLEGGETFRLSKDWYIEAVHTAGHTWGHLAVYDPRAKALAAGEAALWTAILDVDWNPALPPTYCYVDTYLANLERLMAMDIEVYSAAHWPVQRGTEVAEFLRESRNYCLHVEQKLLKLAQTHGNFTLRQAIQLLGAELGAWSKENAGLLTYPMGGNLSRLVQRGKLVVSRNSDKLLTWSLPT